jgi:4-hydroxy-tetrahydrodipicolinate reductase
MTTKVCIAGATGWIGQPLCRAVIQSQDLELVGAVGRSHAGQDLGSILNEPDLKLRVCGSVKEALVAPADVLVDFTHPEAVKGHVLSAIRNGISVVIGTSGLANHDYQEIDLEATKHAVGVIACGNFAITAALLLRFACEAAKYLSHWEILDYASATKPDAPSGMTRELSYRLGKIKESSMEYPLEQTVGHPESRGVRMNGTQIHSVRLPGYIIGAEVLFGEADERLAIRYDAGPGAGPYLPGTLLAIRKVRDFRGLIRGLDRLL